MKVNVNYELLKKICLAKIQDFKPLGTVKETTDGLYIYKENSKAKILGVAHLDTVLEYKHFHNINMGGDDYVFNSQLDDRLGVYTLLDVLPRMEIQFDLLLTEGEEQGRSTAAYFESQKDYNWMFSFDRHGHDVVMYQYDNPLLRDDLKRAGLTPSYGSFSDIAFLDQLGIRGINVGTGYEGEHGTLCYANMRVYKSQVKRFKQFYDLFQDKKYPYTYTPSTVKASYKPYSYPSNITGGREWTNYYSTDCYLCQKRIGTNQIVNDIFLCDACFNDAAQCAECEDLVYADELMDGLCINCQDADFRIVTDAPEEDD